MCVCVCVCAYVCVYVCVCVYVPVNVCMLCLCVFTVEGASSRLAAVSRDQQWCGCLGPVPAGRHGATGVSGMC